MEREELFKPFIEIGEAAGMRRLTMKRIANMSDRGLVKHFSAEPGEPRRYSLVAVLQMITAEEVARMGFTISIANQVALNVVGLFLEKFDAGERDFTPMSYEDNRFTNVVVFWIDANKELVTLEMSPMTLALQLSGNDPTVAGRPLGGIGSPTKKHIDRQIERAVTGNRSILPEAWALVQSDLLIEGVWLNCSDFYHWRMQEPTWREPDRRWAVAAETDASTLEAPRRFDPPRRTRAKRDGANDA